MLTRMWGMANLATAKLLSSTLKFTVLLLDLITLPVHIVWQQPWEVWKLRGLRYSKGAIGAGPKCTGITRATIRNGHHLDGPTTMDQLIKRSMVIYADRPCLGTRRILAVHNVLQGDKTIEKYDLSDYEWSTYGEVNKKVNRMIVGLHELGLRSRDKLAIIAETREEWLVTALAALQSNISLVTLYSNLGEDGIASGLEETEVRHVVTSQSMLPIMKNLLMKFDCITHVVYMEDWTGEMCHIEKEGVLLLPFSELLNVGDRKSTQEIQIEEPLPSSTAIIMYTSGSTGKPKGVMISHLNLLSTIRGSLTLYPDVTKAQSFIAYLPLAHVLELGCECMFIGMGARIGYSSAKTLTDKSLGIMDGQQGDVNLLKPTMMMVVPLILDRVKKAVLEAAAAKSALGKLVIEGAVKYKTFWSRSGFNTPLLNRLVFQKIKNTLGGQVIVMAVGSAPISQETYDFIKAVFDIHLIRGYGLTETTAGATSTEYSDDLDASCVGAPFGDCHIQLVDWLEGGYKTSDLPNPRGEVIVGGSTVTTGYFKNEKLTEEEFFVRDGVRWFRSGDIGELLPNGTIRIIDRKKDLIKLQYGEYIALGRVEAHLKTSILIDNACVVGDSYSTYLVALIYPNWPALERLAASLGSPGFCPEDLCRIPEVIRAVESHVVEHCRSGKLNKMETPRRIKLCPEEWLPNTGLVTAAMKIRRKPLQEFYSADIKRLYEQE